MYSGHERKYGVLQFDLSPHRTIISTYRSTIHAEIHVALTQCTTSVIKFLASTTPGCTLATTVASWTVTLCGCHRCSLWMQMRLFGLKLNYIFDIILIFYLKLIRDKEEMPLLPALQLQSGSNLDRWDHLDRCRWQSRPFLLPENE